MIIYGIRSKLDGEVFYIGRTKNLYNRIRAHRCHFNKKYGIYLYEYIKENIGNFEDIEFVVLAEGEFSSYEAFHLEDKFMNKYKTIGKGNEKTNKDVSTENLLKNRNNEIPVVAYVYKTGEFVGEFKSEKEASEILGVYHISDILKGKRKSSKGYTFKYKEGESDD